MARKTAAHRTADDAAADVELEPEEPAAEPDPEPDPEPEAAPEPDAPETAPVEPGPADGGPTAVAPEVPFGEDPDDFADGSDEASLGDPDAPPSGAGVTATYAGLKGPRGGRVEGNVIHPSAITVVVPAAPKEGEYDGPFTEGTTYTFHLDQPRPVLADHKDWLAGYPAFHFDFGDAEE